MSPNKPPEPPSGLQTAGADLWASIVRTWQLDARESALLAAACHQADDNARLESALDGAELWVTGSSGQPKPNPLLTEARNGRLALDRILQGLKLPDPAAAAAPVSRRAALRQARGQVG
jgi:hypothetical protein